MPESLQFLNTAFQRDVRIPLDVLALRLVLAFALGCAVGGIYRLTQGRRDGQAAGMLATLVLLTVLVAVVIMVIGSDVAKAFTLVGALGIVRFRTVVEDTRDTAFVIFAVAMGMAVGSGYLEIPVVGFLVATLAAFLFRPRKPALPGAPLDFALRLRVVVGTAPDELLGPAFGKHLEQSRLLALATVRQGAALELSYAVRLRRQDAAVPLGAAWHGLDGVQEVELRPG